MACFAESLRDAVNAPASHVLKLYMRFAVELGLPFLLSIFTAVLLWWLIPDSKSLEVPTDSFFSTFSKFPLWVFWHFTLKHQQQKSGAQDIAQLNTSQPMQQIGING